ncbi:uncharacterized protein LOC120274950 [Dioscorea cayenensis subsp. rotundata]|uniref:Uncharacterized protein LOC120274950 n=1 Tax=Dioscorea cayennensis subsp. rotundata TaxID=55577 RepID=A0AB40CC32_DIOCR|nr:uncharacterized protein LOC120274950 [Dioscorea cayenensis subsp. rotundata]
MATSSNPGCIIQLGVPVFDGEGYEHWCIKMKTYFRSQDLWDLVEKGFVESDAKDEEEAKMKESKRKDAKDEEEAKAKENKKRDAKALYILQQAVHPALFSRISSANTANEAWERLKTQFLGSPKIMAVKIQSLRQVFENLHRKENESVQFYISRVNDLANQMRGLGDTMPEQLAVGKILRSLGPKYNHLVAAIGEAKDLTKLTMDELSGSLQAHESLMISQDDKTESKLLQ